MPDRETRKTLFVAMVERLTAARLADRTRKHTSCVNQAVGPAALARMFRSERLPVNDMELEAFAARLTDWALGLSPAENCPYAPDDLM